MIVEVESPQPNAVHELSYESDKSSYYQETVKDLLKRIFPKSLFFSEGHTFEDEQKRLDYLNDHLPFLRWNIPEKMPGAFSVVLVCKQRRDACSFFYDMISRWALPGQRLNVDLFFACDFRLPELSPKLFTISEIVFSLKNEKDLQDIRKNLKTIESEIRLGIVSDYHANRILKFKGLSTDEKTTMIQEKIGSLIQNRSKEFDRTIFSQMQQFLVNCDDEFKKIRDYHHISRIISLLHTTKKLLNQKILAFPDERHLILKFLSTKLNLKQGQKTVLGVMVGLSFLRKHEIFEKSHLIRAIQDFFPNMSIVAHSFFLDRNRENTIQALYLEVEKKDEGKISLEEIKLLRKSLPEHLKSYIKRLSYPVFMPRNEEEILRNITVLSRQLKYVNDFPQVVVNFDEQRTEELSFTVVFARILHSDSSALKQLLQKSKKIRFSLERVKKVGLVRKKYVKEASVFRARLKSLKYLRQDYTMDLRRARGDVIEELTALFGEVRDYNGGMIHKQNENYQAFKNALGKICLRHEFLIEKFFFSLVPNEMRSILKIDPLKTFFLLFLSAIKKIRAYHFSDFLFKQEDSYICVVYPTRNPLKKKCITAAVENLNLSSYKLVKCNFDSFEIPFGGYLFLEDDKKGQKRFLETLQQALDF